MAELTTEQLSDLRADIGDQQSPHAFTDAELQRNFQRRGEHYQKTLILCLEQLLTNTAKFYKFVSGFTRQEQDQIFDNLAKILKLQRDNLSQSNQVILAGLSVIPPSTTNKTRPDE
jgi:mannitol-1-phosphate/altronate dehydrogenase